MADDLSNASPDNAVLPVDMKRLFEVADDDEELARELVEMYVSQMTGAIEKMDIALADDKANEINRLAHTAVGSSATIGITALVAPLKELERLGKIGELENAAPLIAQVKAEMARVELFFEESLPMTVNG